MGQSFGHRRPALKIKPQAGGDVSKIGKADDYLAAYAQRLMDDKINLRHLLHALVKDNVIEGLIGILHQSAFDVAVDHAQALFYAAVSGLIVKLYPLNLGIFIARHQLKKFAFSPP